MKKTMMILFVIIFFAVLIGANIYLSNRFAWYFGIENATWFYVAFAGLTLFMITGMIAFTNAKSLPGSILFNAAAITMGFVLYLLLAVLLLHLFQIAVKPPPVTYGLAAIGIAVIISLYGMWNAGNLTLTQIKVPVKGLKAEVKAMHLTDIHLGHYRGKEWLEKIVDQTNKQEPDVVFITGDLFDGRIRLNEETIQPLKKLNAPVFFVEGNHDGYSGTNTIKKLLRRNDIHVMENEVYRWNGLQIVGLNHMLADHDAVDMHANGDGRTIKDVLGSLNIDENIPSILLHHSPDGIQYASEKGIDVFLAGHTHAGQMFPINLISELIFPYNKGLHNFNGTRIFVSEGAGTFGPPMRIATKSEITLVELVPELN